ncbi:hypothetical protein NL676_036923 [Syzygium grande]|nr:hypothetical protein NL676_036923 [Syzygium grande]
MIVSIPSFLLNASCSSVRLFGNGVAARHSAAFFSFRKACCHLRCLFTSVCGLSTMVGDLLFMEFLVFRCLFLSLQFFCLCFSQLLDSLLIQLSAVLGRAAGRAGVRCRNRAGVRTAHLFRENSVDA